MTELICPPVNKRIEPINEEKPMLKSKIERTTTSDVIQMGQAK
jgi:hypothetical protein